MQKQLSSLVALICLFNLLGSGSSAAAFRNRAKSAPVRHHDSSDKHQTLKSAARTATKIRPHGGDATPKEELSSLQLALAGAVATMIGDASVHPIDCIKTLQQSTEGAGMSMIGAGKQIVEEFGVGGLYAGLGTYVLSDGGAGAVKFASYEALKQWTSENIPEKYNGAALFGCGALAFVASSIVLVPGELIKQRLQMGMYNNLAEAASAIWNTEGFFGFYRGYAGVCLRDIPYTMLELGIYDNLKAAYLKFKNRNNAKGQEARGINQFDEILAAAVSGAITGYLTNPLDTIKTKLVIDTNLYNGFFDCLTKTVQDRGVGGLFQGAAARVSWIMPFTAVYLPIYESLKRGMQQKAAVPASAVSRKAMKVKGGAQGRSGLRMCIPAEGEDGCGSDLSRDGRRLAAGSRRTKRLERNECFVSF